MKIIVAMVVILFVSITCFATGWHDYELDIGDGYRIFRYNSIDVCIGKVGGSLILLPRNYADLGPVVGYFTTQKFIFTKNIGRKDRNLFKGDTFQDLDTTREFYFIITKHSDKIIGPLAESDFVGHPHVSGSGPIEWQVPRNPNLVRPLLGDLMFLAIAIPILAVKYFWVSVPLIATIIILTKFSHRKRKEKRMAQ